MITVVVLAHNDEAILTRCLESLRWTDEIVVIDDESSDKTSEIARKFGANVFRRNLDEDFSAQRNFGLEMAKGEWVLFVDSDEVVSKELAEEIRRVNVPDSGNLGRTGYLVKRSDFMSGKELKHGETASVKLLRLARKDEGRWEQPVHEVWIVKGKIGELSHPLLHFPHQTVAQFLNKINRYSTIHASYLSMHGVRVAWWQIILYPKAKFFLNYIVRLGFLDGTAGVITALMMSFHSFLVRAKLYVHTHTAASL